MGRRARRPADGARHHPGRGRRVLTTSGVAVVTIASGRHDHLRLQRRGLIRNSRQPDLHVVVAMDDPELPAVVADGPGGPATTCIEMISQGRLALAAARNRGAEAAIAAGAQVLVFLDVDCIPGQHLVERYERSVRDDPGPGLYSGPVAYLPPPPPTGYDLDAIARDAAGHPARPVPPDDAVIPGADHTLFWSLSFALSAPAWLELGGFCEAYDGYGAEDTDFAQLAARRGIGHSWVGGAWAYHQHHPTADPPVQHLHDIVLNANRFHARWGWWPMTGWLEAFERLGLARPDPETGDWAPLRG